MNADKNENEIEIRALVAEDAEAVAELAIRSKTVWGYLPEQMAVFRKELTISAEEIDNRIAFGSTVAGQLIGFYTVKTLDHNAELEHLFVAPAWLRRGVGTILLRHALNECSRRRVQRVTVLSDPNAAGFYEKAEATLIEMIPSSIPGRAIPKFQFDLSPEVSF